MAENEVSKEIVQIPEQAKVEQPVVEAAPKVEKALTPEEITARYKELAEQTRSAGLSLLGLTMQTYLNRIKAMTDDVLAGIEGASPKSDVPTKKV